MAAALNSARALLPEVRKELFGKPNVVGTGIGYKVVDGKQTEDVCIICSVDIKKAKSSLLSSELLPRSIQDIPIDVVPTGVIYAQQDPKQKYRPAPGGVSVGHFQITAGTLGCWVKKNNKWYILSNNHVMANSNDASIGDPIYQPGPYDGGTANDQIATLSEFVTITYDDDGGGGGGSSCPIAGLFASVLNGAAAITGSSTRLQPILIDTAPRAQAADNLVDAAIAEPQNQGDVRNEILNIGTVSSTAEAVLGMSVKKMGRTTDFTTGVITQIDATVQVNYGAGKVGTFSDQLIAGPMSAGGDSGSAVVSADNRLVGLLFAGSQTSTIINRIQNVFSLLNLSL